MTNGDTINEQRQQVARDFEAAQSAVQKLINSMQAVFASAENVVDEKLDEWHEVVTEVIERLNEAADHVRETVANVNWNPAPEPEEGEEAPEQTSQEKTDEALATERKEHEDKSAEGVGHGGTPPGKGGTPPGQAKKSDSPDDPAPSHQPA